MLHLFKNNSSAFINVIWKLHGLNNGCSICKRLSWNPKIRYFASFVSNTTSKSDSSCRKRLNFSLSIRKYVSLFSNKNSNIDNDSNNKRISCDSQNHSNNYSEKDNRKGKANISQETVKSMTDSWIDNWIIKEKLCPFAKPLRLTSNKLRVSISMEGITNEEITETFEQELVLIAKGITKSERDKCKNDLESSKFEDNTTSSKELNKKIHFCSDEKEKIENGKIVTENDTKTENCSIPTPEIPESTLIVFPKMPHSFEEMYQLSWKLQQIIIKNELIKDVQLVLFHPEAVHSLYEAQCSFDDEDENYDEVNVNVDNCDSQTIAKKKSSFFRNPTAYALRSPFPTIHLIRQVDLIEGVLKYPNIETIPQRNSLRLQKIHETKDIHDVWSVACQVKS
eukprot:Awhi_evm1s14998